MLLKFWGEGRLALSLNSACMAKLADTIIVNHQLEFSGTRV